MDRSGFEHNAAQAARARERQRAALQRLANLLDQAIPLPGGFRIGLDGIIGLVPGVGDLVGSALSSFIVLQASRLGASRAVLFHMAGNIALETVLGVVPVVGDLFDFAWKANLRNVQLLERHLAQPRQTHVRSTALVAVIIAALLVVAAGAVVVVGALVRWLWLSVTGG